MPDYFNEIYSGLKQTFEQEAHCLIDEASDLDIRFRVMSTEFAAIYEKMDFYERQIYPNTAEGNYLKKHGAVRGIVRKSSTCSTGFVSFTRKLPAPDPALIPKDTLLTCSRASDALFKTTANYTIPANVAVGIVPVESIILGERGAVPAGHIDVLVAPVANIISVTNENPISGGFDTESDELFKKRVIDSYSKINNGVNLNFYEQFAKAQSDIWYAKASFNTKYENQIDLYVENYERTISDASITALSDDIGSARELGITVVVARPTCVPINVTIMLQIDNMANKEAYSTHVKSAIDRQIKDFSIGQPFSPALIISKILPFEGIHDLSITSPASSISLMSDEICSPGTYTINAMKWGG